MRLPAVAALAVLLAGLAWPAYGPGQAGGGAADAAAPFAAFHYDSEPVGNGYVETWCVTRAPAGWATGNVTALLDGAPTPLEWVPEGEVRAASRFRLTATERDVVHELALLHGGVEVWRTGFGAGAGDRYGCG